MGSEKKSNPEPTPIGSRRAFTLLELLLCIGVLGLLLGILIPTVTMVRKMAISTHCTANLRQIAGAFHQYAMAQGGYLPDPYANHVSWEASLQPYVADPQCFLCPADHELAPAIGASYDWRDTGNGPTTLAGKSLPDVKRSDAVLAFDALPGWHGWRRINAAFVDGSARQIDDADCFRDLAEPIR